MCGIAGIWNFDGGKTAHSELQKMLSVQQHRGPEDAAFTSMAEGSVLMGFLKLGFTDEQLGMQPLFNEDGKIAIVYNGEIYDYEAIRSDLVLKGHQFYTNSDSEVLIHLYEEYGVDFIHQLNGEFAFVIYDDHKKQLFAGRDPFGINPLTYTIKDSTFYFSSEAKGILVTQGFERTLDPDYLHSVCVGIPNTRLTMFKGIQNLRPGHCMIIDKNGIQKHYQYWNPSFEKTSDDFLKAQSRVKQEIRDALCRRMKGNPPISLALSSGLDSTIIAGLSREMDYKTPVFSLGYSDRSFDESAKAEVTAKYYNLPFNKVEVSLEKIIENFEKTLFHTENITNSLSNSARFLMNKAIRDSGLKAITSGEASDEIFGGYPYFILEAIWRKELMGDSDAKKLFKIFAGKEKRSHRIFWNVPKGWKTRESPYSVPLLAYLRAQNASSLSRLWSRNMTRKFISNNNSTEQLFTEEIPPQNCANLSGFDSTRLIARSVISSYNFPGLGDRPEMGNSLEGRIPFLDNNVVQYAYSLPESYCLNMQNLDGKYILREAFKSMLPPQFLAPAKHSFMSPPFSEAFATGTGKDLYHTYLSKSKIKSQGIINPATMQLLKLLLKVMPRSLQSYLFVDSLSGIFLSVQILHATFIDRNPLDKVELIPVRELFPGPKAIIYNR
jgi:asparagine synthase (glutamine-hydrolysing)